MNQHPLSVHWLTQIYYVTSMGNLCPPLPTSFHRVTAVFIFSCRWSSHKWVGPDECGWHQGARDTWEVKETWGDSAEEDWAWWGRRYLFNTGSPKLLPLPSLPSPFFSNSHFYLEERFWQLLKASPLYQYFYSYYFLVVRHGYKKPYINIHKALSVFVPIKQHN